MKWKTLLTLIVATVVIFAAVLALRWQRTRKVQPDLRAGRPLITFDVNQVAALRIQKGTNTLEIVRADQKWRLRSLYDYPADRGRIAERLLELSELVVGQVVPGSAFELSEFGLTPAEATVIEFTTAEGTLLGRLALGKSRQGPAVGGYGGFPDGQYARVDEGQVVVLARNLYGFGVEPRDWVQTDLVNVRAEKGDVIEVAAAEASYRLRAMGDGKYEIEGLGAGEALDESVASRIAGALQWLSFTTIADPAATDEALGFDRAVQYQLRKADGLIYTARVGGEHPGGGRYARLTVQYEPPPTNAVEPTTVAPTSVDEAEKSDEETPKETAVEEEATKEKASEAKASTSEKEAEKRPSPEELQKQKADRAIEENERLSKWTFVISNWAAESLTMPRSRLIKPAQPQENRETPKEEESAEGKIEDKPAVETPAQGPEATASSLSESERSAPTDPEAVSPASP